MIEGIFSVSMLAKVNPVTGAPLLRVSKELPPVFRKYVRIGHLSTQNRPDLSKGAVGGIDGQERAGHDSSGADSGNGSVSKSVGGKSASNRAVRGAAEPLGIVGMHKYNDLTTYLDYARRRSLSTDSTVFQGNFYELQFLEFLRNNFAVKRLMHQGGRDDKGIDIRATWNPVDTFGAEAAANGGVKKHRYESVNSVTRVKPIVLKKDTMIRLFVQCKSWEKARIDAKMIREINGTFNNTGKPTSGGRSRRFLMMVCPTGFTRQGRIDFDRSLVPLIYIKFSRSRLRDPLGDVYSLKNYELGSFESFYCNPMANALLKGLNWTDFMKRLGGNTDTDPELEDTEDASVPADQVQAPGQAPDSN